MTKIYTIDASYDANTKSANLFNVQYQKIEEMSVYKDVLDTFRKVFELVDFKFISRNN